MAGRVIGSAIDPDAQATAFVSPAMAGLAVSVQLEAWDSEAVSVVVPPEAGTLSGDARRPVIEAGTGVGAATVTFTFAVLVEVPVAARVRVYFSVLVVALAGRVTGADTDPPAQEIDPGRPLTVGFAVTAQVVAPLTEAVRVVDPPEEGKDAGAAARPVMVGAVPAASAGTEATAATSPLVITTSEAAIAPNLPLPLVRPIPASAVSVLFSDRILSG